MSDFNVDWNVLTNVCKTFSIKFDENPLSGRNDRSKDGRSEANRRIFATSLLTTTGETFLAMKEDTSLVIFLQNKLSSWKDF